ncbi:nucleotidyl transferase AbiEii/AbiGii toxin family protein [Streptomyces sp. NBC_01591]|uniref:nucleotidyl transferase AbiEii/AbiGii toxin family protein n=1 Tax=Streptomyces sp. NBC_01591 TaxID=2975888 RepID=UPI002DDA1BB6|nr:nucleotidyl transferase AbiEii/AbiGii toxin family protein [Streptomyces sp. NBC_01591]WSD71996.1 nucleotidyl transferase AbiEii/AbiGii toxin family protein [Streptomyces sp. NBC_01591]
MSTGDRPVPGEPAFDDPALAPRWRAARRGVQDHLLRVIAESSWGDGLILRGSLPLQASVGAAAREPGDLDWVMYGPAAEDFVDRIDPYPYVAGIDLVQHWPEAADGAAAPELWTDEESHETAGARPVLAPEGLRWIELEDPEDIDPPSSPTEEVVAALTAGPLPPEGIRIDPSRVASDGEWMYREYETPGVRVVVPWQADGLPPGELRMDFAQDERLLAAPVWTACPRGDGGPPTPVRTASPGLSLAWKLLWLAEDQEAEGRSGAKDLYDAVLLAEYPGTRLSPRLLRTVLGSHAQGFTPGAVLDWLVDWAAFHASHPWVDGGPDRLRERLAAALPRLLERSVP